MSEISLSVILPALNGVDVAAVTLQHLRRQTREDFEVVLVTRPDEAAEVPGLRCRSVSLASGAATAAEAYAAGIRSAEGDVVALTEDHAFPARDWVERLLAAHAGPWVAVCPAIENANPRTLVSRADLLLNFLDWVEPGSGPAASLAPHNSSYARRRLLDHAGDDLTEAIASERTLHFALEGQGLYVEAGTSVAHVNLSLLGPFLRHKFLGGWIFAGFRSAGWSPAHRTLRVLATPLVPFVRGARILARVLRTSEPTHHLAAAPALALGLVLHAAGEALGYLTGPDAARERYRSYTEFESRRGEMIRSSERRRLRDGAVPGAEVPA